ncbi:MAG: AIM24 family protein [Oscillospiraceae bacterium]|nr:AIM24 family protein [Oscillospiraceae bacterium]
MSQDTPYNCSNIKVSQTLEGSDISIDVIEYDNLTASSPGEAMSFYYMNRANIKLRQCVVKLKGKSGIQLSPGAMSFIHGRIDMTSNVKGVGDFFGKVMKAAVTKEQAIKPLYKGVGEIFLEPSYRHYILLDLNNESVCVDDGMFFAASENVKVTARPISSISAATLGGEGLFNLCLEGTGPVILECKVPESEIVFYELVNDILRVDGNFAVLWSSSLKFTVQKSGKSLLGSAVSGEGLVNVYEGSGRVWLAPTLRFHS